MPLVYRPHSVSVLPSSGVGVDVVTHTEWGGGSPLYGMVYPETPVAAYEATGLEITRPHVLMVDLADAGGISAGDRIAYGARRFEVRSVRIWDAEPTTAHAQVYMQEMR
jgi:hypothetical protein